MLYTIITGASSGIGRAFAKEYAKRGDNLILIARSKDKLLGLKEILESTYTINVQIINYDLSQEKAGFTIYQIINILRLVVRKSPTGESSHYFFFMLK